MKIYIIYIPFANEENKGRKIFHGKRIRISNQDNLAKYSVFASHFFRSRFNNNNFIKYLFH